MTTRTLIILDGVGIRNELESNAFAAAHTPTLNALLERYPNNQIETSGLAVGLPPGQMGNSEVGHMDLGAGRIVYQSLTRINKAIDDGALGENERLQKLLSTTASRQGAIHIMGLLSDGGVHSHIDQIVGMATRPIRACEWSTASNARLECVEIHTSQNFAIALQLLRNFIALSKF
ncbi:hypothetical protein AB4Z35_28270 [Pseudomonas sp. KB_15]|uniref:hypothetical protein n=1 Tax=Pseudomonas sp. KB_15 TaxID=3233035 RepID=UPI003F96DFCE